MAGSAGSNGARYEGSEGGRRASPDLGDVAFPARSCGSRRAAAMVAAGGVLFVCFFILFWIFIFACGPHKHPHAKIRFHVRVRAPHAKIVIFEYLLVCAG